MERVECYSLAWLTKERLSFVLSTVLRFNREVDSSILEATQEDFIIYNPSTETFSVSSEPLEGCESVDKFVVFNNVDFGTALSALKEGKKVAREGWNGKGMFAVLQKGYPEGIPCNKQTAEAWGLKEGDLFKVRPYFQLRTAQGDHAMWTPSGSDILSDDWIILG